LGGEPDIGEHVEQTAVRCVDQPAHIVQLVGIVAALFQQGDEVFATIRVAPLPP